MEANRRQTGKWMRTARKLINTPSDEELYEFVVHSNRIEGEPTTTGHPLFDDHLAIATSAAARAGLPYAGLSNAGMDAHLPPLTIHKRIIGSQPWKFPGEYRQCNVFVSGKPKMNPVDVRPAMLDLTADILDTLHSSLYNPEILTEEWCWEMHHRFEHIHPFIDGNGRTGRILLNQLRLRAGLPWYTVKYEDRFEYYRSIEEWEARNAE